MKRAWLLVVVMLILAGCGKKSGGPEPFTYQNMTLDLPKGVQDAESIGAFTNDHEKDQRYRSEDAERFIFAEMDAYYLAGFRVNLAGFRKSSLSDLLEKKTGIRVVDAEKKEDQVSTVGIRRRMYAVSCQVLASRDLFADMTGCVTVLSFRNDVWVCAALTVKEADDTAKMAGSVRIEDPGAAKEAFSASDLSRLNVQEEADEVGQWGRIDVMDKKTCGERVRILARVEAVYDETDSYGLIKEHEKALKYTLSGDRKWLCAKVACFYGSLDRKAYDPYVDVRVVDKKGDNIGRTYRLFGQKDSFCVFYEDPGRDYGLRIGDGDFIVRVQ